MCLWIQPDQDQNEKDLKKWFGNRKKFAYVYKVLRKWSCESFYRSLLYGNFKWDFEKQKEFQVDRDLKLTKSELLSEQINKGFHVYTSLKLAKSWISNEPNSVIVKFKVRKENIIAIQNSSFISEKYRFKELVCTRLEFVKVIE
jgi:hypothetical protein